ncbi:uncharacterized protein DDB_G0284459-like [Patiria miniata]|uniref:Uncharacterized protein n=1 Tax=Patiria miniata TaxID=46514 RepID=A0A914ASR6_PATMI|nr:uncharacterized protein DDB_G0284459-like [Patiria miniata]
MAEDDYFEMKEDRIWKIRRAGKKTHKKELATFTMTVEGIIEAGTKSGLQIEVKSALVNVTRTCFVTTAAIHSTIEKFSSELTHSFGSQGDGAGGLFHSFSTTDLRHFFMQEMRSFHERCMAENIGMNKVAASCIGKQPGADVWMLSPEMQLDGKGKVISRHDQKYVWVNSLLSGASSGSQLLELPPSFEAPTEQLHDVFDVLFRSLHENALSAIFAIASVCMCMHYETVVNTFKCCPIPIIVGDVNTGKTTACRMASRMMGLHRILGYTRERYLPRQTSSSSFPVMIDDVEGKDIESLLTKYFNGGVDATCAGENEPRTCPVFTANWFAIDKFAGNARAMSRAVMVPFVKANRQGGPRQSEAELHRNKIEDCAVHTLPVLISLGRDIAENSFNILTEYKSKVQSATKGLECEDRIYLCYAVLLFVTEALIARASLPNVPVEAAEVHLREVIAPHGIQRYQTVHPVSHSPSALSSPSHPEFDIPTVILKATDAECVGKLLLAINPRLEIKSEHSVVSGLAFHLNGLMSILQDHKIPHSAKLVWRNTIKTDLMIVDKVQAFFNTDSNHTTISRSRANSTHPKNRLATFIPFKRFTNEQLKQLEKVFQVQTGCEATADQVQDDIDSVDGVMDKETDSSSRNAGNWKDMNTTDKETDRSTLSEGKDVGTTDMQTDRSTRSEGNDVRTTDMQTDRSTWSEGNDVRTTDMQTDRSTRSEGNDVRTTDMQADRSTWSEGNDVRTTDKETDRSTRNEGKDVRTTDKETDRSTRKEEKDMRTTDMQADRSTWSEGNDVRTTDMQADRSTWSEGNDVRTTDKETDISTRSEGKNMRTTDKETDRSTRKEGKDVRTTDKETDRSTRKEGKDVRTTDKVTDRSTRKEEKDVRTTDKDTDRSSLNEGNWKDTRTTDKETDRSTRKEGKDVRTTDKENVISTRKEEKDMRTTDKETDRSTRKEEKDVRTTDKETDRSTRKEEKDVRTTDKETDRSTLKEGKDMRKTDKETDRSNRNEGNLKDMNTTGW